MQRIGFGRDGDVPPGFLGQTHTVFARDAATQGDDALKQLVEGLIARRPLRRNGFIEHQVHVDIPITGMAEAGHLDAVLFLERGTELEQGFQRSRGTTTSSLSLVNPVSRSE